MRAGKQVSSLQTMALCHAAVLESTVRSVGGSKWDQFELRWDWQSYTDTELKANSAVSNKWIQFSRVGGIQTEVQWDTDNTDMMA